MIINKYSDNSNKFTNNLEIFNNFAILLIDIKQNFMILQLQKPI